MRELALFPVDPKPQLAELPEHQVPVIAQLFSGSGQNLHQPCINPVMPARHEDTMIEKQQIFPNL